ncbi:GGDEF domain-containing protein [Anoxynatronum buryatiense]|uniref:Diguanylate cyclase (GGDEF) domain-containing protein n=1 Tax=Anoxynatronum buryatiense TaxID=489973 RepID=A0AA46AJQ9_9CLOT|nr:GGDEF domain-containing protein [Anoxynatronum buryatiense]SMP64887.1 diguanylate cyclase (GGDEF) domain-containing protein [Anoxynatronum buryatiense]
MIVLWIKAKKEVLALDTIYLLNRLTWLLSLVTSSSIVLLAAFHPFNDEVIQRRSRVFMVPLTLFVMNALHFTPGLRIEQVLWLGDVLVLTLVVLIIPMKERGKVLEGMWVPFVWVPMGMVLLTRILYVRAAHLLENIPDHHMVWPLVLLLAILYRQGRAEGRRIRLFFTGSCILTAAYGVQLFGRSLYMPEVSLGLKVFAYGLWTLSFYLTAREEVLSSRQELDHLKRHSEKTAFYAAKKRENELNRTHQTLMENAKKDGLTGAFNRISIMDFIDERIRSNIQKPFAILMFDIDKFKTINDNYGHVTGDNALRHLADTAGNVIRGEDRLGRYGGDEFIILLPSLNLPEATMVAERMRERIKENSKPPFTISMGIAVYPQDGTTVVSLIEQADRGLYKSKSKGGNAVSHVSAF